MPHIISIGHDFCSLHGLMEAKAAADPSEVRTQRMKEKIKKFWGREEVAACKLCGTPLRGIELPCPDCGYLAGTDSNVFYISGDVGSLDKEKAATPAAAPMLAQETPDPGVVDGKTVRRGVEMPADEGAEGMAAKEDFNVSAPVFALDPTGLREMLAEQPEMLEPGLSLVIDKKGNPIRAGFSTAVGNIDLLARDASGALVVVKIAGGGEGEELVEEILQRIGWVRKHLGKGTQQVRGIVLLERAPENLGYAVSAVAGMIAIKTYRVGVTFQDVEI